MPKDAASVSTARHNVLLIGEIWDYAVGVICFVHPDREILALAALSPPVAQKTQASVTCR